MSSSLADILVGASSVQGITASMTGTTSTKLLDSVTGSRICITSLTVTNTDSDTATEVQILDDTTVIESVYVPAGTTVSVPYPGAPLKGSTGKQINAKNITTASAVRVSARGYVE